MQITAHIIPKNSGKTTGDRASFAVDSIVGTGAGVASAQLDFLGGRGSLITGMGTNRLGSFVSCKHNNIKYHSCKLYLKKNEENLERNK